MTGIAFSPSPLGDPDGGCVVRALCESIVDDDGERVLDVGPADGPADGELVVGISIGVFDGAVIVGIADSKRVGAREGARERVPDDGSVASVGTNASPPPEKSTVTASPTMWACRVVRG